MALITSLQNSSAFESGFNIGYLIGIIFPFIVLGLLVFFVVRYFRNKSKK